MRVVKPLSKLSVPSKLMGVKALKNVVAALVMMTASSIAWAACARIVQDVGYDFTLGAKTGIAAPDAGVCVQGATTVTSPGDDFCSGSTQGDFVIRTNDTGVVTLKYVIEAGTTINDYTLVIDIPKAGEAGATSGRAAGSVIATWDGVPAFCTGSSAISNGGTRLTCNLGTISNAGGQLTAAVPANIKISPRSLNGERFDLKVTDQSSGGSFVADGVTTPLAACAATTPVVAPSLIVSARPKIDIRTAIYNYSPVTRGGVRGYVMDYFVYVDGLGGSTVGGESVQSPLNFNVGLGSNVPAPGVQFIRVFPLTSNVTTVFSSTAVEGSPAGGSVTVPVTLTPAPGAPNCGLEFLVPGGACQETPTTNPARLATHGISYFVPLTAFPDGVNQINFNNFINSNGSTGPVAAVTPSASGAGGLFTEPVSDNIAPYTAIRTKPGSYAKYTAQFAETNTVRPPGSPTESPATLNEPGGQANFNWCFGGSCKQYPTKNVESLIQLVNSGPVAWDASNGGSIVCDKFDNRGMVLTAKPRSGGTAAEYPTNTPGDVIVAIRTPYATNAAMPDGFTVEVATAPGTPAGGGYPSNAQNCGDGDATWITPGAGDDLSAYNLVRIKIPTVRDAFTAGGAVVVAPVFFFTVPLSAPNGAYIGNQLKIRAGSENFGGTGPGSWSSGTFNPLDNTGVGNGERFQVVKALVRTQKTALNATGAETSAIAAGRTVTFVLSPSFTAAPGVPAPNSDISVVDVLPLPMQYVPGTARSGSPTAAALEPNSITTDASGRQVLTWVLPNVALNSAIPPILFDARVPTTTPNGTVIENVVTVAAPLVDQSTDAERSAKKSLSVQTLSGLFVDKAVSTPLIPRNGTFTYTLSVGNLKNSVLTGTEIIDMLPANGSSINSPVNNFVGTIFLSAQVAVPAGGEVYYTSVAPGQAPTAASSTVGGGVATTLASDYAIVPSVATKWCTFSEIGTNAGSCPATLASVTAIRVKFANIPELSVQNIVVPMGTANNAEDSTYVNRFSAKASGLDALFSNDVITRVKQAKISGKVYVDANSNSQFTAGETAISGVTVTLTGVDSTGANVTRVTTTDASGNYSFGDLLPGTYVVTETQPAAYASAGANLPGTAGGTAVNPNRFESIVLAAGQDGANYNFGEIGSSLAGKVCEDLNNDGKCTAGEPPIEGVLITLTGTDSGGNAITRTATTTATGDWKIADLGNPDATGYTLTETQPTAYLDGKQSPGVLTPIAGGTDAGAAVGATTQLVVGNDTITGIKFTQATNGTTYDFAEVRPASLQGFVYYDLNKDGTRTTATPEPGIVGVSLELTGTNDLGQPVTTTTTSVGSDGSYTFGNLRPGTYTVREVQPASPAFTVVDGTITVGSVAYTTPPVSPAASDGTKVNEAAPSSTPGAGEGVSGIVLGSGGAGTNYNFGEVPLVPVSGRVFVDKGYDGLYNAGTDLALPLNSVTTLTLCLQPNSPCTGADIIAVTTSTPGSGTYSFPPQPSGSYYVVETQPAGYASSSPNIQTVTLVATPVIDVNFAETGAVLSGTVYSDNNGSGAYDVADLGIPGVAVKLCLASSLPACTTPVSTTTTIVGGSYTFADVPAPPAGDSYVVVENEATGALTTYNNGTSTVGTLSGTGTSLNNGSVVAGEQGPAFLLDSKINGISFVMPIAVTTGAATVVGTGYNFGELPITTVSGAVILDRDFGGTQTPGDTGLSSTTTVTLCRSAPVHGQLCPPADVVASTTTTPGSGAYTFPVVTPGTYYVVETQPAGYGSSSPNTSAPVNVTTAPIAGINFYEAGARLSGTVYKDADYSGTNNAGDIPLPGVTVRVCTTANCATGSVVATTTTSATGLYQFNDLPAPPAGQSYFVVEDQTTVPPTPTVLSDGTTTVGAFALAGTGGTATPGTAVQSPSRFEGVTWTPPTSVQVGAPAVVGANFNFGEIDGFDVGGKVFFDANRNGDIDSPSDTPLSGVVMTLCRVATVPCPPTSVVGTTTTNVTGDYTFPRVPPGDYFVQETQPLGYGSVPTPAAPAATDVRPIKVAGTNVTGINFADTLSSIAGLVYRDDDGSQTRTGAETTMPAGITITLTGTDATGVAVTRTTVTNASGTYVFDNLRTGTYAISESQPAGFGNGGSNPGALAGGTGGPNSNQITNIQLPANTDAPNYNFGDVPKVAGVAGTVWRDNDHDRLRDSDEPVLPGWTVQVLRTPFGGGTPTLVATAVSDANGAYSVTGLEAGGGYSVRFIAPGGAIFGGAVDGEQGIPISGASVARGEITNLTLTATVTGAPNVIPQQSLPVDPSGVVYDSDTRLPVPGAQVRFEGVNCPVFDPAIHLVGGAGNQTQTVGPDGFYQFVLNNGAPACEYRIVVTPPGTYQADPAIPPQAGPFSPPPRPGVALIVPNSLAPQNGQPTTHFLSFNLNPNSQDLVNNHIPLVARVRPVLFVTKVANKSKVELGDTVKYTVKVRYASGNNNLTVLKVVDTMPAGFKLIADTSFVSVPTGAPAVALAAANITGAPGAVVTYNIPVPIAGLAPGAEVELTYRVRVAVGSMQGDGINRAQALSTGTLRSNIAQAKVIVDPGVFTPEGCVAGKMFVDCNNNHIQDAEELGVPNVRLYMEDGTYFITDSEGKYNYCGLSPKSHVITVDMLTMPRGSRLTTTSNRNLGDANSIFLDVKNGQLIRADFAEGSCSNTVLEQVKARRTQGEVRSTDTEKKGQPALKWEGKSAQYPQQGTDGANQRLVAPRTTNGGMESAPEQNTPVPQMPGASSNTQGANVRNAK